MSTKNIPLHQKQLVMLGAAVIAVAYGMARFSLGLTTPRIVEDGVATSAQIGYASSLSFATYVIACFISGAFLKKARWQLSIYAVMMTAVIGCLLVAFSHTPLVFMAGVGIAGAAAGFASGAVAYRLVETLNPQWEARGQAIANAGTGIGVGVATGLLLLTSQWRLVFIVAAALAVLVCVGFLVRNRSASQSPEKNPDQAERRGRGKDLGVPVALTILMGAGSSVYWTYGRVAVEKQAGLSESQSLLFWGVIGVAGIAGSFSGDAVAKLGTRTSWMVCSVILGLSILCLPWCVAMPFALLSGMLFGAFYTVMCGLTIELGREAWPASLGSATSILFATIAIGQALGSLLNGVGMQFLGMNTLFVVSGVFTLLGCALVWFKKSAHHKAD